MMKNPWQSPIDMLRVFFPGAFPKIPQQTPTEPGEYLTFEEAMEYLRLTERQLKDLCRAQNITHARIDYRTYRFKKTDLDEWFEAYKVKRKSVYRA